MTADDADDARASTGQAVQAAAHTPGPWAWFTDSRSPYLATPDRGRLYVMGLARSGMQGATVRFAHWEGIAAGVVRQRWCGIMEDGIHLRDGRMHPDAALIAAAPLLLETLRHIEGASMDITVERSAIREAARAAIALAGGSDGR